jgi:hypothetical protein
MVTDIVLICLLDRLGDERGREGGREEGETQILKLRAKAREGKMRAHFSTLSLVHLH